MATICTQCGEPNPPGFRFCGSCGAPLADLEQREVRKVVTVLFADVVGSTAIGEQRDPEAVRALMRGYFESARSVIERHGGTVEKFIGDAVMAVFGIPQAHEDDALRAVRAAQELRETLADGEVRVRVGVNTGEVVAGEGGTLVTGDAVNVAARLEQAAESGEILLGPQTLQLVRDAVRAEPTDPLTLKGKGQPVEAARLLEVDASAPAFARRLDSPLVGRRRELGRLRDDFEQAAADSSCHLFTLLGPAGVGKSRLVAEFVAETGERARVLRGRCLHYGEGITYWPLVEVLIQLGIDPETILGLPSPTEASVATRKLLEAEAASRPLVLVFDDLQWAEPTFLDLLEHVVDWSRDAPVFLLGVARPELLEVRPAWGGGKPNATTILLEALGEADAETLIANLLGTEELADETRDRIVRASEGNPLFVEEMLLMLREHGNGDDVAVPPTIRALLQARIDRLGTEERSVVERGAVEGQVFHRSPVAELAPAPVRSDLDGHLLRLVRKELIRPETATIPGDDAFRFRHLLIRDAAYESLPKETRAELHERFADWLDAHTELVEQEEIVGYHLEQAARYRSELGREDEALAERAARRLTAAGRSALGRGDVRAGTGLLERAVNLFPDGHTARLRALPDLAYELVRLGRFEEALGLLEELESSGDERAHAWAAVIRPYYGALSGGGSMEEGRAGLAAARATFEELGDQVGLARALFMEAGAEWTACRATNCAALLRSALTNAERTDDAALLEDVRVYLVSAYAFGPVPLAEAECEIGAIAEASAGVLLKAAASRALGRLAAARGDFESARELMRRGREPLAETGLVVMDAAVSMSAAFVEDLAGDPEAALRVTREGFDRLEQLGEHGYASTLAVDMASFLCELGRDEEAEGWVRRGRELSPKGDASTLISADYIEAILLARHGQQADAERLALRAVEQAQTTDFWERRAGAYEALAEVLERGGRREEAREALQAAIRAYEEKGAVVPAERARALLGKL